jgi:Family of unknown function (DUF5691)
MMEDLRATALLGTSREPFPELETGSEIDALLASIDDDDRERGLLLTAGALSVWQRAGYQPVSSPEPTRAPADTLPGCTVEFADLLIRLLRGVDQQTALRGTLGMGTRSGQTGLSGEHADLLPEALVLLRERGLRLRYYLLPDLLPARTGELRTALRAVMGERGRWLAGFNPTWAWAADTLPDYSDWLWQNGKTEYRVDLLEVHRRLDPAGARERLEMRFSSDRPEARLRLLDALETGLSLDDEPFLERVLDLGSPAVRRRAAQLLATLPQSAVAQRMRDRADAMLVWKVRRASRHRLQIAVPASLDPAWEREGVEADGYPPGNDPPGYWMMQTVGLVPVRHWIDRFGVPLEVLIAGLEGDRAPEVLEAWTHAAVLHGECDLLPAVWDAWWDRRNRPVHSTYLLADLWSELAGAIEPAERGERLARLLADPPEPEATCGRVLEQVQWPWPEVLGDAFLEVLRAMVRQLSAGEAPPKAWIYALGPGARGIPASYIEPALAVLSSLPSIDSAPDGMMDMLDVVTQKLQIRRQFIEELKQ